MAIGAAVGGIFGGGGDAQAGSVDPTSAIQAFQSGADVIQQQLPMALRSYGKAMNAGTLAALESFQQARKISGPFTQTSTDAMDEMRKFMGLAPVTKVGEITDAIQTLRAKVQTPGIAQDARQPFGKSDNALRDLENEFSVFGQETDPAKRRELKSQLQNKTKQLSQALQYETKKAHLTSNIVGARHGGNDLRRDANVDKFTDSELNALGIKRSDVNKNWRLTDNNITESMKNQINELKSMNVEDNPFVGISGIAEKAKSGDLLIGDIRNIGDSLQDFAGELENTSQDIATKITDEPLTGYTAEEVTNQLEELPEYQFQLTQGLKAMERTQAAKGILQSGRAALQAQEFGQGLAQNVYSGHLSRLAQLSGISMPVTQQGLGQAPAFGQFGAQQAQNIGGMQYQTTENIARSREQAYQMQGQGLLQSAMQNAQMQTQTSMANAQMGQQSSMAMGRAAGSLLGGFF